MVHRGPVLQSVILVFSYNKDLDNIDPITEKGFDRPPA